MQYNHTKRRDPRLIEESYGTACGDISEGAMVKQYTYHFIA